MTSTWIFFIVIHLLSIGFTALSLLLLYRYIKRYRFNESKYTLLFGFMHLRWITVSYVIATMLWVFVSIGIVTFI